MELSVAGQPAFAAAGGRPFDPTCPALVLVHGAGMDRGVWVAQTRRLARRGVAVLAVDLPGHGRSPGPKLTSIAAMADWLVALLDAAGLATAALAGHSMGAVAALTAAARYGERVRALALLGATARMPVNAGLLTAAQNNDPAALDLVARWSIGRRPEPAGAGDPPAQRRVSRLVHRAPPGALYTDLAACDAYQDGAAAAAAVRCPTLVVIGERDRMTPPAASAALAGAIPGARAVTLDAGHMMMLECPDAVLDLLAEAAR